MRAAAQHDADDDYGRRSDFVTGCEQQIGAGVVQGADSPMNARFQGMLMRSPATRIEGGSDEILRNIIAERVLGLPGDIRVDKDVPYNKIPTKGR